mgnify:CR=1 FL=1
MKIIKNDVLGLEIDNYGILKNKEPKQLHRFNCFTSLPYSRQIIIKEFDYCV